MRAPLLVLLIPVLALTGCQPASAPSQSVDDAAEVTQMIRPTPVDPIQQVFSSMTLDQKIGQLLMAALDRGSSSDALADLAGIGGLTGVLLLGNGWDDQEVSDVAKTFWAQADHSNVRLYLAVDQEGGAVQRLSGQGFDAMPSALEQGAWTTDKLVEQSTKWALQLSATGVNLNLAPVADTVPAKTASKNAPIGAFHRQFGSDPAKVGDHVAAFVQGMSAGGVASCIKHFPGLGRITGNTDVSAKGTTDTVATTDDPYLEAFRRGMAANPAMVMVSLATYSKIDAKNPAVFSSAVINDLLRGQLGWDGVVISDALNAKAIASTPVAERGVAFIKAGGDIAIIPGLADLKVVAAGIKTQAQTDPAFAAMVDQAVLRVLNAKMTAGLFNWQG